MFGHSLGKPPTMTEPSGTTSENGDRTNRLHAAASDRNVSVRKPIAHSQHGPQRGGDGCSELSHDLSESTCVGIEACKRTYFEGIRIIACATFLICVFVLVYPVFLRR